MLFGVSSPSSGFYAHLVKTLRVNELVTDVAAVHTHKAHVRFPPFTAYILRPPRRDNREQRVETKDCEHDVCRPESQTECYSSPGSSHHFLDLPHHLWSESAPLCVVADPKRA